MGEERNNLEKPITGWPGRRVNPTEWQKSYQRGESIAASKLMPQWHWLLNSSHICNEALNVGGDGRTRG